jgi:hypothetical protein
MSLVSCWKREKISDLLEGLERGKIFEVSTF